MLDNARAAICAVIALTAAVPASAEPMTGSEFTDIFNTAVSAQPYAACLMPEQFNQLSPANQIAACDKAAGLAETSASITDRSGPAQSGVYRMIEFFALGGESSAMLKVDGMRSRRICRVVIQRAAIPQRIDYSLYSPEVQRQLHSALDGEAATYQLCHREFPDL